MSAIRLGVLLAAATLLLATVQAGLFAPAEDAILSPAGSFAGGMDGLLSCPGGLEVGVAAVDVTPGVKRPDGSYDLWMEPFVDENGNGVYDGPDLLTGDFTNEPFTDENLNGKWDGPFMAGYGHEKRNNEYYVAEAVHDPVWARAVALGCGGAFVGLVSVDTVGLFRNFVRDLVDEAPSAYAQVVVASTHTHDSIDTMGLWGPSLLTDGKDPRTMAHVKAGILEALRGALASVQPAAGVQVGWGHTRDLIPVAGSVQTDLRDPFVIDDKVMALRFVDGDGATLATIINWSPHPETMAGTKSEISSDYAHYLRLAVERDGATVGGVTKAPVGGTAVFFSGAVGGMMTTLGARVLDESGRPIPDYTYEKVARIGEVAAFVALDALEEAPVQDVDALRFQRREQNVLADNPFLMALNTIGVLDHEVAVGPFLVPALGEPGIVAPVPFLRAETNLLTLEADGAPVFQALTVPGELLPEVALGNPLRTDAQATFEACYAFVPDKLLFNGGREGKVNPATGQREAGYARVLAAKPAYPKEPAVLTMTRAPAMLLGLANDELGYIVPANDFEYATVFPDVYSDGRDRCGDADHYEETNSASSLMAPAVANMLASMLDPTFTPAPMPTTQAGFVGDAGEAQALPDDRTRGVWLDTSRSAGFEPEEDARVTVSLPSGLSGCWGFLNGHGQPIGEEPSEDARGFWVDLDGDCQVGGRDGVVFADAWALSEGQPRFRP